MAHKILLFSPARSVRRAENGSEREADRSGDENPEERALVGLRHEEDRPEKARRETDSAEKKAPD
jgi:hypothetical protein